MILWKNEQAYQEFQIDGIKIDKNYNQIIDDLFVKPEKEVGLDQYQTATWDELEIQQRL